MVRTAFLRWSGVTRLLLPLTLTLTPTISAQCLLPAIEPAAGANYGSSIAVDGDWMLIGDEADSTFLSLSGSVHVHQRVAGLWQYVETLYPDTPRLDARFGFSVALRGDVALIGAQKDSTVALDAGAVYVFRRLPTGWVQEQQILASNADFGDKFGYSLDIEGTLAVVGAYSALDDGALYVFEEIGGVWSEQAILTSNAGGTDLMGISCGIEGGRIFGGAPLSGQNGSVSVFEFIAGAWSETQVLLPVSPIGSNIRFGECLAVDGDRLVVGAPYEDQTGGAFFFERQGGLYVHQQTFLPASLNGFAWFAHSIDIAGNIALVGAPLVDVPGFPDDGEVWILEYISSWEQTGVLRVEPPLGNRLGYKVTLTSTSSGFAIGGGGVHPFDLSVGSCPDEFRRGDLNLDFFIDTADPIYLLSHLFIEPSSTPLFCVDAADINDDGLVDVADPISLLGALFLGTGLPPFPGFDCGYDPTTDALDCDVYPFCP